MMINRVINFIHHFINQSHYCSSQAPLYLTGKADCADNNQSNNWMDPVKKADVCCAAIPFLGVVGCKNDGVDKLKAVVIFISNIHLDIYS